MNANNHMPAETMWQGHLANANIHMQMETICDKFT